MRSIDTCVGQSKASATNPLVLIFFSGHGARDRERRHYLVPHNGMRDDLFATACGATRLRAALRLLPETSRVVVFVDACHAAGIGRAWRQGIGRVTILCASWTKEGTWSHHVWRTRYPVRPAATASSHTNFYSSYAFRTRRCRRGRARTVRLYDALKRRVVTTTDDQQEPWSNIQEPTKSSWRSIMCGES